MRDLINKLTLLESSDSNIKRIATYLEYESLFQTIALTIKVKDYYKKTRKFYMSRFFEKNLNVPLFFRLNYVVTEPGNLKPASQTQLMSIGDYRGVLHLGEEDPTKEIRRLIVNDVKDSGLHDSELAKSFRTELINMGFADNIANEFTDAIEVDRGRNVNLDKTPHFNKTINDAYQWRLEGL